MYARAYARNIIILQYTHICMYVCMYVCICMFIYALHVAVPVQITSKFMYHMLF